MKLWAKRCSIAALIGLWIISGWQINLAEGRAGGSNTSKSSSSSSSRSSSSSPSHSVWGSRSGGGSYGKTSTSGGYSKPGTSSSSGGYAKPGLSSTSSGGSSGYSKPGQGPAASIGSGYSKPEVSSSPKGQSSGYAKPGQHSTSAGEAGTSSRPPANSEKQAALPLGSKFDTKMTQTMQKQRAADSLKAYQTEQTRYSQPPVPPVPAEVQNNPVYQKAQTYSGFNYDNHYSRRENYYQNSHWTPPAYTYNSSPSFGMWDGLMWWMVLDRLGDRRYTSMAYHHADDPGYQQWRKEADRLAQNNEELKTKLAKFDTQVQEIGKEGIARDPSYLVPGMSAEVALAPSVLAQKEPQKPKLRFATGPKGQNYEEFGKLLQKEAGGMKVEVELMETAGSLENLKKLISGEADAALVQSDVLALLPQNFPGKTLVSEQAPIYRETVQLIAHVDSGIKSIKDLDPETNLVYIGPEESGTARTWEGLCQQDEQYRKIKVKHADYDTALKEVENNPKALMMMVSGFRSELLKKAEKFTQETGKLRLVAVDDWDFNDKRDEHDNHVYNFVKIPAKIYPSLQKGWIWGHDVETLAVQAVLVLRNDWVKQYGKDATDALSFAVMLAAGKIYREVDGLK
jgi:TRAP transporter TAXI family solute receptor